MKVGGLWRRESGDMSLTQSATRTSRRLHALTRSSATTRLGSASPHLPPQRRTRRGRCIISPPSPPLASCSSSSLLALHLVASLLFSYEISSSSFQLEIQTRHPSLPLSLSPSLPLSLSHSLPLSLSLFSLLQRQSLRLLPGIPGERPLVDIAAMAALAAMAAPATPSHRRVFGDITASRLSNLSASKNTQNSMLLPPSCCMLFCRNWSHTMPRTTH